MSLNILKSDSSNKEKNTFSKEVKNVLKVAPLAVSAALSGCAYNHNSAPVASSYNAASYQNPNLYPNDYFSNKYHFSKNKYIQSFDKFSKEEVLNVLKDANYVFEDNPVTGLEATRAYEKSLELVWEEEVRKFTEVFSKFGSEALASRVKKIQIYNWLAVDWIIWPETLEVLEKRYYPAADEAAKAYEFYQNFKNQRDIYFETESVFMEPKDDYITFYLKTIDYQQKKWLLVDWRFWEETFTSLYEPIFITIN